jgi:MFS family permease
MHDENHRRRTLWLCTALHAFTHVYQVALIPLYLRIQEDFHLESDAKATFLVTILSIAYFLPSYPMGVLADRVSRKKLLGWGLALNAFGYVGLAFAPNYATAVLFSIVAGLGGSFFHPSATALIARLYPEATGKALGKVAFGASLGFFVGPIYAGWRAGISSIGQTALPWFLSGWRGAVFELGVLGIIGAVLFYYLAEEKPAPATTGQAKHGAAGGKLFATPTLWMAFLAMSFLFCLRDFAGSGMVSLGSLFLQHAYHFTTSKTGVILSFIYLASMISNPLFGRWSDGGRLRWTIFLLVCASIAVFIFPRVSSGWFQPTLAAYGFFFMASYPVVEAALMETVHDSVRGRVFGCFITVGGLLGNLSHWFVGEWVKRLGDRAGSPESYVGIYNLLAFCIVGSMSALIFLQFIRNRKRQADKLAVVTEAIVNPPLPNSPS